MLTSLLTTIADNIVTQREIRPLQQQQPCAIPNIMEQRPELRGVDRNFTDEAAEARARTLNSGV